ncbi:MAG: protein kinase, partial [Planctomycetota bacterium]
MGTRCVIGEGMPAVLTQAPGDLAIDAWTTHCPSCGREVAVPAGSEAVACPHCHAAFAPERLATTAGPKTPAPDRPRDPRDALVGARLGRWHLLRILGRGGMGRVYLATDQDGRPRVAVKVLSDDLASDPAFVKRFHREARVLASLSHPHVVEILDQGEAGGRLYFAMEYVRGENLRRLIERGPLPVKQALRIADEVASALAYAHTRGVIHRDLKPENVLLDEKGRVHLADFGLSRLLPGSGPEVTTLLTRTDVILGTYEYMAPEQRRGEKGLDARADIYALGVILYEMLTGTPPLGRFELPSRVRSGVPPALDAVVARALAPRRGDRQASVEVLKRELREAASK